MSQPDAIIRIKNLRLRTFIGIKEEEILNRQISSSTLPFTIRQTKPVPAKISTTR